MIKIDNQGLKPEPTKKQDSNMIDLSLIGDAIAVKVSELTGKTVKSDSISLLYLSQTHNATGYCSLQYDYYWAGREWNYHNIHPKIICEKVLVDQKGNLPMDYKFMCFGGEVKLLFLDIGVSDPSGMHAEEYYRNMRDNMEVFTRFLYAFLSQVFLGFSTMLKGIWTGIVR